MTYNFVVWEGAQPLSNAHAASEHRRLKAVITVGQPPTRSISRLVEALVEHCPDNGSSPEGASVWLDAPLIDQAHGPVLQLRTRDADVAQIRQLLIEETEGQPLVAFDPQRNELVPSAVEVNRTTMFQLPHQTELELHLIALIKEQLRRARPVVGVLDHMKSGFYLQWMVDQTAITVEARSDKTLPVEQRLSLAARDQMLALGFHSAEPNWTQRWYHPGESIEKIGHIIAEVVYSVRRFELGDGVAIQTFPVR